MMSRSHVVLAVVLLVIASSSAHAEPRRYALLIGSNGGDRGETVLRYANSDAQRLGRILQQLGSFRGEDIIVLQDANSSDARRAIIDVNARLRAESSALLFVYYSGHGDGDSLHLNGTRLPLDELRGLVSGSAAPVRVLVIDACRSGGITRVKGGRRGPSFDVHVEAPLNAEGMAILTSSAASEDSQESDSLAGSIFTHYLASALVGAADADKDGQITIGEAFAYAASATLAETASTAVGPQHPTYRLDLAGREDLVLTRPSLLGRQLGALHFRQPGRYLIARGRTMIAELETEDGDHRLTLESGRYHVTRRGVDHLLEGDLVVAAGTVTDVVPAALRRVDYARVVRKGGTARRHTFALSAALGARGSVLGLGEAPQWMLGARVDLAQLSLELRLAVAFGDYGGKNDRGVDDTWVPSPTTFANIRTYELTPMVAALRAFDVGRWTFGLGIDFGLAWIRQQIDTSRIRSGPYYGSGDDGRYPSPTPPARDAMGVVTGILGQTQLALRRGWFLQLEASFQTYLFRVQDTATDSRISASPTFSTLFGFGVSL
jgi:hypothetical protein